MSNEFSEFSALLIVACITAENLSFLLFWSGNKRRRNFIHLSFSDLSLAGAFPFTIVASLNGLYHLQTGSFLGNSQQNYVWNHFYTVNDRLSL